MTSTSSGSENVYTSGRFLSEMFKIKVNILKVNRQVHILSRNKIVIVGLDELQIVTSQYDHLKNVSA